MTEYEVLDILSQHVNTTISLLQWWVGITVGILVGVHVIGKELNGYLACLLISIFSAFTTMIGFMAAAHRDRIDLLAADLEHITEQGGSIGEMSKYVIESAGPPTGVAMFAMFAFWGLIISTIAYTIYCYRKAKQAK